MRAAARPLLLGLGLALSLGAAIPPSAAQAEVDADLASLLELVDADLAAVRKELGGGVPEAEAERNAQRAALNRLEDVLERTASVLRIAGELRRSQRENAQRVVSEPGALLAVDPPFPVPLFDAISTSWQAQRDQAERLTQLHRDTKETVEATRRSFEAAERARRRAKEAIGEVDDPVETVRLKAALNERELESRILAAELRLTEIQVEAAALELAIQLEARRQAKAARDWVRAHLQPATQDLNDTLAAIAKRRFDLERALESTRLDLTAAGGRLASAQQRVDEAGEGGPAPEVRAAELATRRLEFTSAQRRVVLLGERMARLDLLEQAWGRRYQVLAAAVTPEEADDWNRALRTQLDDLDRQRRIKDARLGELQSDLDALRGEILEAVTREGAETDAVLPWLRVQETELNVLVQLYRQDVASLDETLVVQRRLAAELVVFDESLAMAERIGRIGDRIGEIWRYELTSSEDNPITVGKIVTAMAIIALGWLIVGRLGSRLVAHLLRRIGLETGAVTAFQSLFFYACLAAIFLIALRVVNIPLTAFALLGGALALGFGFGSQAVISNFISGLILLAERPIKTGDHVEVDGVYGQVERIGLRSTRIRSGDNFHIIVPNASFLERSVVNWTHANTRVRIRIAVGVAYGSDTRAVEAALLAVADAQAEAMKDPPPVVLFRDFGDSALLFELRVFVTVRSLVDRPRIESEIRFAMDERLRADGITIAFPQRDLHLDSSSPIEVKLS